MGRKRRPPVTATSPEALRILPEISRIDGGACKHLVCVHGIQGHIVRLVTLLQSAPTKTQIIIFQSISLDTAAKRVEEICFCLALLQHFRCRIQIGTGTMLILIPISLMNRQQQ